jgi:FkbH-like protein
MQKILITGSCYLFPENSQIWSPLKKNFITIFNEFALYEKILEENEIPSLVVLSFKDILNFPIDDFSTNNERSIKKKIYNIFSIFKKKIRKDNSPLILVVDFFYGYSYVRAAQRFYFEEKIKSFLEDQINSLYSYSNFYCLNIGSGVNNLDFFDNRLYYLSKCRYSFKGLSFIAIKFKEILDRIYSPAKKVLILDCDNTLWGGVVGEDGVNNLEIGGDGRGAIFYDFQKSIKRLKNEGILLCLTSKNNHKDVEEVFNKNKNMLLGLKDFVSIKANWDLKSLNILKIKEELNLGLDSFVFFDDNPFERDLIKKKLTEVCVIDPDDEIANWPEQISNIFEFTKFKITKEDSEKTKQYKQRVRFLTDKRLIVNERSFLKMLKLKASLIKINKSNMQRCIQIIQKTNQFNLTNKRFSEVEIKKIIKSSSYRIFMVDVDDKYGKHGLVAIFIIKLYEKFLHIENIAMSCRVLGRCLENWIIKEIIVIAKKNGKKLVVGEYLKSNKNQIVNSFYEKMKFKKISPKDLSKIFINEVNTKSIFYSIDVKNNYFSNNLYK